MEESTLLFRHLPAELSEDEKKDLLFHFGASRVRVMGVRGPMKNRAFAVFPSKELAAEVLHQLHQATVLGSKLIVEFASPDSHTPSVVDGDRTTTDGVGKGVDRKISLKGKQETEQREIKFDVPFATWGLKHPRRPELKYRYPPPTPSVLTNIMNALAAVPKFYVQVLHLMNKMDLPAPFGALNPAPPMRADAQVFSQPDNIIQKEMDISSGEETESEMESDEDDKTTRLQNTKHDGHAHRKTVKRTAPKKPRLSDFQYETPTIPITPSVPVKEVFEQMPDPTQAPKKIALNISTSSVLHKDIRHPYGEKDRQYHHSQSIHSHQMKYNSNTSTSSSSTSALTTTAHSVEFPALPRREFHAPHPTEQQHHLPTQQPQQQQYPPNPPPPPPPPPPHHHLHHSSLPVHNASHDGDFRQANQHHGKDKNIPVNESELYSPSMNEEDDGNNSVNERKAEDDSGGFGILQHVAKKTDDVSGTETEDSSSQLFKKKKFISSSALRKGRLSEEEMKESSVFRRYDPGEVSCRLYIKNVSRQAAEEDLHYIYGRYVDWDCQSEINMFDIRLMKEGRMKGQAFVNLPSEEVAKDALSDTNGFLLKDKPLVVQFARSAKAQEDTAAVKS